MAAEVASQVGSQERQSKEKWPAGAERGPDRETVGLLEPQSKG
jgi:hypothetical protein